jgi:hypothetical protein
VKDILIYHFKLFCRNICIFPMNIFFSFHLGGGGGVAVIHFVLQTIPELKLMWINIR